MLVCKMAGQRQETNSRPQVNPQQLNALLQEFQDLEQAPALPEPRSVDHSIELQLGSGPQMGPIFRLAPKELDELKFVEKKDGPPRM